MLQRRSQTYRPPVSWKNAQLLPHAKSNTTITWRFSVSFLRLPGHPVCNSKIHNTYVAATGLEPGIPGFRGVALSPACCPVAGGTAQIVMTQGVHGTMCAFGPTRRGVAKKTKYLRLNLLRWRKIRVRIWLLSITRCFACLFSAALGRSDSWPPDRSLVASRSAYKRLVLQKKHATERAAAAKTQKTRL